MIALEAENLFKTYPSGEDLVTAVRGVSLQLHRGELVLLMGPSGSGKTTLLSMLGLILTPDRGTIRLAGDAVVWEPSLLAQARRNHYGFIYQHFNLFTALSARENVELPLRMAGVDGGAARERARTALEIVGLWHRESHRASQLSAGEQQRVAIARALVTDPPILLADEPTGNLDSHNGREIMRLLAGLARFGKAVLVVTHDPRHVAVADRVIRMQDGTIVEESGNGG